MRGFIFSVFGAKAVLAARAPAATQHRKKTDAPVLKCSESLPKLLLTACRSAGTLHFKIGAIVFFLHAADFLHTFETGVKSMTWVWARKAHCSL